MHTDRADETCVLFVFLHQSVALAIASPVHPTHPLCNSRVHTASTTPVHRNCKAACWYTPVRVVGSECYTVKNAKLAQKERKKRKMKRREGLCVGSVSILVSYSPSSRRESIAVTYRHSSAARTISEQFKLMLTERCATACSVRLIICCYTNHITSVFNCVLLGRTISPAFSLLLQTASNSANLFFYKYDFLYQTLTNSPPPPPPPDHQSIHHLFLFYRR